MSRFPLSGLARPALVAVAASAAVTIGSGLTAAPAADAATRSTSLAKQVQRERAQAMSCQFTSGPGTSGLNSWPIAVRGRVAAQFGITDIGGYRPGHGKSDHHSGNALDVMVRGEEGDRVADWARDNAKALNIKYVIWEQGYWHPGMRPYRPMGDRGNETANHFDHVHISFKSGSGTCPAS